MRRFSIVLLFFCAFDLTLGKFSYRVLGGVPRFIRLVRGLCITTVVMRELLHHWSHAATGLEPEWYCSQLDDNLV